MTRWLAQLCAMGLRIWRWLLRWLTPPAPSWWRHSGLASLCFIRDADFLRLHASGTPHQGIVYAHQQTPASHILRSLMLLHDVLSPDDMVRHVEFL